MRLSGFQLLLLTTYAVGMVIGQTLLKLASASWGSAGYLSLLWNRFFVVGIILYFLLTVFWVWLLRFTPLSFGYPFAALAFALTPLAGIVFVSEAWPLRLFVGVGLIFVGLLFVAS